MALTIIEKKQGNTKITEVEETNNASWFVVLPHYILSDKDLSPNAKLIYAEISALTRESGFCWAGNKHFGDLLGIKVTQVSRLISQLSKKGYINIEINRNNGNERKIYLDCTHIKNSKEVLPNNARPIVQKDKTSCRKLQESNSLSNSISILSKDNTKQSFGDPSINEIISYLKNKIGTTLDSSEKENRQYCLLLIRKIKKDYPDKETIKTIKALIDVGLSDDFHSKNITNIKYLYYNTQKIIMSYKAVNNKIGYV